MHLSTKGRFAVNALIDLALHQSAAAKPAVALASIAARQQISLSYLEQLFSRLRRAGIVASARGPGGGYMLGRAPEAVSVADVVRAVEEPADAAEMSAGGHSQALWQRLHGQLLDNMAGITLASLVAEAHATPLPAPPPSRPAVLKRALAGLRPVPKQPRRLLPPNSVFAFGRSFAG